MHRLLDHSGRRMAQVANRPWEIWADRDKCQDRSINPKPSALKLNSETDHLTGYIIWNQLMKLARAKSSQRSFLGATTNWASSAWGSIKRRTVGRRQNIQCPDTVHSIYPFLDWLAVNTTQSSPHPQAWFMRWDQIDMASLGSGIRICQWSGLQYWWKC